MIIRLVNKYINMSTCYKTSDNKFFGCPARMSDGRHFTDYRPSCDVDASIRGDNNIGSSFEYRTFLQRNAESLMNVNRKHACMRNCCVPCKGSGTETFKSTMLPEKYKVQCNKNTCTRTLNDINGLGDGRVYFSEPPTCDSLPAVWPQSQPDNVCTSPHDRLNLYGDAPMLQNRQRNALPR